MGTATEIGTAYVSVIPGARGFAKTLRKEIEEEFRAADLDGLLARTFGGHPVKLPVQPEVDPKSLPDTLPRPTRVPKLPVELDPLVESFRAEVNRQVAELSRTVNANIPVGADTAGLRTELAAEIAAVQRQLKAEIPTEPGSTREYEEKLRAAVDAAARRVEAHVKIDVDKDNFSGLKALTGLLEKAPSSLAGGFELLSSAMTDSSSKAVQFGGALSGALSAASGPVGTVVAGLAGLAAVIAAAAGAAVFAVPAITALAGAVAAIPGALTGVGAAFGALSLGFKGISEAFKPKTGGGRGAGTDLAAQARQVAQATRGVESAQRSLIRAQRDVVDAQKAVNKAIADEVERRQDLQRAVHNARLDQRDAALSETEALRELNKVRETGDIPAIQRAQLEYEKAQARVSDTADATQDLKVQQAAAAATTVRGSDQVQAALKRQQDAADSLKSATDGVTSAQEALTAAQNPPKSGGGGGAAAALIKLAPAARKFVDAIKALKPAFEALRLDVQQRLFVGLDKTVTTMWKAWKDQLHTTLGSFADTFNSFFRTLGANVSKPKFITDLATGAEGARKGLQHILDAIAGPLVTAFGDLSAASAPFLESLGKDLGDVVTKFSNWVIAGDNSGGLQEFFDNATSAMHDIFDIGGTVATIIGDLIDIIVGKKLGTAKKSPLQSFREALQHVADWLNDPANQDAVRSFFIKINDELSNFGLYVDQISGWITQFNNLKAALFGDDNNAEAKTAGEKIGEALVTGIIVGIAAAMVVQAGIIADLFWAQTDSLIGWIKSGLGIHSPSTVMAGIGRNLIDGLMKGIGDRFGALVNRVTQIPGQIRAGLGAAGQILLQKGRDVVTGLGNGLGDRFAALQNRAAALRTVITNRLSDAGSWLYNVGRNVVIGLYNGIASLGSWLAGAVRTFINNYVPVPIQQALGINSPSKVAAELGRRVPEGLAAGMTAGSGLVEAASRGLAAATLPSLVPALVGNPTPGLGTATGGPGRLEVAWAKGSTGDRLLDALRDKISVSYNGDPVAALRRR